MLIKIQKYIAAIIFIASLGLLDSCSHHDNTDVVGMGSKQMPAQMVRQDQLMQAQKTMPAYEDLHGIGDSLSIVQIGDYTTIKIPANYFFTRNTSNLVSNFYDNIRYLSTVVQKYNPSVIKVHVVFPVTEKTERFDAIVNNQSAIFVAKLSQYVDENISSGVGQLINSQSVFNPKYLAVGEYIELQLSPKQ